MANSFSFIPTQGGTWSNRHGYIRPGHDKHGRQISTGLIESMGGMRGDQRSHAGVTGGVIGPSAAGPTAARTPFAQAYDDARDANLKRYQQGLDLYGKIAGMFEPGGSYGQGMLTQLDRHRDQYIAQGEQDMASRGLYSTTERKAFGKKWEEEVGAPARAKLEDQRMSAYAQALGQKAQFIERREDMYPEIDMYLQLMRSIASSPQY